MSSTAVIIPTSESQEELTSLKKQIKQKADIDHYEKQLKKELSSIQEELSRRRYLENPDIWVEEVLGETLWSKQKEIMLAVAKNRRVTVPSCFGSGKSFVAARLAAWWISNHPPGSAFVVTTATTGAQVRAILWKEIHRAHSKGNLPGRVNQTEWWLNVGKTEEIVAYGRKPADMDPAAFQGIHARFVLVILDEAAGIPTALFNAADGLIVNDESRILAIGNPEDSQSQFATICKPGSGWLTIPIPASSTPNFTEEDVPIFIKRVLISDTWVNEKKKSWGEESPMYKAKVNAEFPETQEDGLIPWSWIRAAQQRTLKPEGVNELGVDVGGGGDKSTIYQRRGPVVKLIRRDNNPDTMETCGNVIHALNETKAVIAKIDEIGIGRGVVDRAKEQNKPVMGINVGSAPTDTPTEKEKKKGAKKSMFLNLRAQGYWNLRSVFQSGDIDIEEHNEELANQLAAIKYKRTSTGQIQIESKKEMKNRHIASPDDGDGVMLAFLEPPPVKVNALSGASW